MKVINFSLLVSVMVFGGGVVLAQEAGQSVILQYGTVESVKLVHNDGKRAGGAVVGGLVGGAIADDHRGLGMLAGGLIGGAVQKHHTGDCVVVEQGEYTNVRRVSSINCYQDQQPDHHVEAAKNCQKAKDELNTANTDDEIVRAVTKVRTLCED